MKKGINIFFMCLVIALFSNCKKDNVDAKPRTFFKKRLDLVEEIPFCLEQKIRYMEKYNTPEDFSRVLKWTMKDGSVYYNIINETGSCDDCSDIVYDTNCETVCFTGGMTGGDCHLGEVNHSSVSEFVIIWKNYKQKP